MTKTDIRKTITNKIIGLLEQIDLTEFQAPFAGLAAQGMPINPVTKKSYRGINIPSLWIDQQEKKFTSSEWATFNQWRQKSASVRKGEQGSPIIFYKSWNTTQENEAGEREDVTIPVMRNYTVFNADQVEGYETKRSVLANIGDRVTPIAAAETYCKNTSAKIIHGESRAFYNFVGDFINMPPTSAFLETKYANATENYYSVLLHELTHWTGATNRLDRDKAKSRSSELEKYAFEELIAELGAAFLCAKLGISQAPRKSHAHYIKSWLPALRGDHSFIFKAAAQAAKATDYLDNLQP